MNCFGCPHSYDTTYYNMQDPHHSTTEEIDEDKLPERLRTVFNHDVHKSGVPLILLCHDEEMTLSILSRSGVDTSSYESGLDTLLPLSGFGVFFHVQLPSNLY